MRKALVHTATGKVVNIIEVGSGSTFSVSGHTLVDAAASAQIGGSWDGATFLPAPAPTPDPLAPKRTRLLELRAKGWAAMTAAERTESQQLVFEIMAL